MHVIIAGVIGAMLLVAGLLALVQLGAVERRREMTTNPFGAARAASIIR